MARECFFFWVDLLFAIAESGRRQAKARMIRKAFVMEVYRDKHEEYIRRHNPIWRELEVVLKAHGAHNYSIFLHPVTSQLFAYVEIEDIDSWQQIARSEVCQRWWALMREIMPTNPDNSPVSIELPSVFHLP